MSDESSDQKFTSVKEDDIQFKLRKEEDIVVKMDYFFAPSGGNEKPEKYFKNIDDAVKFIVSKIATRPEPNQFSSGKMRRNISLDIFQSFTIS